MIISVLVWAVKALIVYFIVSLRVSCKVTFIKECTVTVWVDTKEAGLGTMRVHMSFNLALELESTIALRAFQVFTFEFILMP